MLKRSSHSVYDCRYHIVWTTKYRKRALGEVYEREYCEDLLRRIGDEYGMSVVELEVDVDHVHLYVEIPPQRSVGRAVGIFKSLSARAMFKRFPYLKRKLWAGELWSDGYFVRSVGDGVTAETVAQYIRDHEKKVALGSAQGDLFVKNKSKQVRLRSRNPAS